LRRLIDSQPCSSIHSALAVQFQSLVDLRIQFDWVSCQFGGAVSSLVFYGRWLVVRVWTGTPMSFQQTPGVALKAWTYRCSLHVISSASTLPGSSTGTILHDVLQLVKTQPRQLHGEHLVSQIHWSGSPCVGRHRSSSKNIRKVLTMYELASDDKFVLAVVPFLL